MCAFWNNRIISKNFKMKNFKKYSSKLKIMILLLKILINTNILLMLLQKIKCNKIIHLEVKWMKISNNIPKIIIS